MLKAWASRSKARTEIFVGLALVGVLGLASVASAQVPPWAGGSVLFSTTANIGVDYPKVSTYGTIVPFPFLANGDSFTTIPYYSVASGTNTISPGAIALNCALRRCQFHRKCWQQLS